MIDCINDFDFVVLAAIIAAVLSINLSIDEINILANLFYAIGDNMTLITGKRELCENGNEQKAI